MPLIRAAIPSSDLAVAPGGAVAALNVGIQKKFGAADTAGVVVAPAVWSDGFAASAPVYFATSSSKKLATGWHSRRAHLCPTAAQDELADPRPEMLVEVAHLGWVRLQFCHYGVRHRIGNRPCGIVLDRVGFVEIRPAAVVSWLAIRHTLRLVFIQLALA